MTDPTTIALGDALYQALWNDPARPAECTVQAWARELLERSIKERA